MVEWKKLGEVCKLERGVRVVKKDLQEEGQIPVYQNSLTPLGFYDKSNYPQNTPFVICAGAAGEVGFCNKEFWAADDCTCIVCTPLVISKYVYYCLLLKQHLLKSQVRKASVPRLSKDVIGKITIPVPSLSEQQRIVETLDTFTASIDNLKEQIAQRRKQYEHYREQLLDLEGKEGVELKTLGSLCNVVTKQTGFDYSSKIKPELMIRKVDNSVPFLQTKNFAGRKFDYNTDYYVPIHIVNQFPKIVLNEKCLLFSIVGASIGNIGLFPGEVKCFLGGAICVLKFKDSINIHYIYEVMSSWYGQKQIKSKTKGAGQATITVEDVRNFEIPYPKTNIQMNIVSVLDAFEASISNLEAQLAQRQKQYEYYRNRLLTFE